MDAKDDRRIRAEVALGQWRGDPLSSEQEVTIVQVDGTGGSKYNPARYKLETRRVAIQMSLVPGEDDDMMLS